MKAFIGRGIFTPPLPVGLLGLVLSADKISVDSSRLGWFGRKIGSSQYAEDQSMFEDVARKEGTELLGAASTEVTSPVVVVVVVYVGGIGAGLLSRYPV